MRSFAAARRASSNHHLQHVAKFHTTLPCLAIGKKREPRPVPKDWSPFAISETLLELDAYDSPHVRVYSEDDEAVQQAKWATEPAEKTRVTENLTLRQSFLNKAHKRYAELESRKTSEWRIDDMDILTVAFNRDDVANMRMRSDEESRKQPRTAQKTEVLIDQLLRENAIPRDLGLKNEGLLDWLLWRQKQVAPAPLPSKPVLGKKLSAVSGFDEGIRYRNWSRFVIWILRMARGPAVLTDFQGSISETLLGFCSANSQPPESRELLAFLNNFSARLSDHGFSLAADLCYLGLVVAADVGNPGAIQKYLSIGREKGYWGISPKAQLPDIETLINALIRDDLDRVDVKTSISTLAVLIRDAAAKQSQ